METMETRGEPFDKWYFAKGQLITVLIVPMKTEKLAHLKIM
jgi:hypothetical protein